MRSHGDPHQAEPTVSAGEAIQVVQPDGYYGTIYGASGQDNSGAGVACQAYLTAASTALHGGQPVPTYDTAQMDRYSACMRAHGVSSYPDPGTFDAASGNLAPAAAGPGTNSGRLPDPYSPAVQKASRLCGRKTGTDMPTASGSVTVPGEFEFILDGKVGGIFF